MNEYQEEVWGKFCVVPRDMSKFIISDTIHHGVYKIQPGIIERRKKSGETKQQMSHQTFSFLL